MLRDTSLVCFCITRADFLECFSAKSIRCLIASKERLNTIAKNMIGTPATNDLTK